MTESAINTATKFRSSSKNMRTLNYSFLFKMNAFDSVCSLTNASKPKVGKNPWGFDTPIYTHMACSPETLRTPSKGIEKEFQR